MAKYTSMNRSRSGRDRGGKKSDVPDYRARVEAGASNGFSFGSGGEADIEFIKHLEVEEEVASLEQRWVNSWMTSPNAQYVLFVSHLCVPSVNICCLIFSDLKPLRIPLHSKKSKRCPSCRHILIKPEQKAQSVRFKIKLVAANYLPAISVTLPHARAAMEMIRRSTMNKATSAAVAEEHSAAASGAMLAGKTYPFHLAFTNPLYDPIQVRVHVQRSAAPISADGKARAPFAVTLPSSAFPIAAYAEAWEYEDDEDMFGDEGDFDGSRTRDRDGRARSRTVGVLERRANVTVVGGEIVLGNNAQGAVKVGQSCLLFFR